MMGDMWDTTRFIRSTWRVFCDAFGYSGQEFAILVMYSALGLTLVWSFGMDGIGDGLISRLMVMYSLHWCLLVRMGSAVAFTKHNFEAKYKACMGDEGYLLKSLNQDHHYFSVIHK